MVPEAARLLDALLAAFDEVGGAPAVRDRVHRELRELLAKPFDEQRLTPGEIWRAAAHADLPESSREAELAWGVAKARAITAPKILYVGADLMDRSKLAAAADAAGARLVDVRTVPDRAPANVLRAFVDLTAGHADEAIRMLSQAGVTTIAYGPHVDDLALVRARALGADDALPRSVFFRRLPELIPVRA